MRTRLFHDDIVTTDAVRERMEDLELDHPPVGDDPDDEVMDVDLWDEPSRTEYRGLEEIIRQVCGDRRDSVTLIHENHFEQYTREFHAETYGGQYHEETRDGMVQMSWDDLMSRHPFNNIDWKAVAADAWSDYSQVEVDGVTYLYDGE